MADSTDGRRGAPPQRRRGRHPTLYDAVAGLIRSRVPRTADGSVSGRLVLAPDEAVFRARNAPLRFEETDRYFAHEGLPGAGTTGDGERVLPDSDLVAAVHRYASVFYEGWEAAEDTTKRDKGAKRAKKQPKRRLLDERSMDETALLAMGILLEEACRGLLGREGEVVFTEGGDEDEEEEDDDEEEEEDDEEEEEGEEEDEADEEDEDSDQDEDEDDGNDESHDDAGNDNNNATTKRQPDTTPSPLRR